MSELYGEHERLRLELAAAMAGAVLAHRIAHARTLDRVYVLDEALSWADQLIQRGTGE